MVTPRTEAILTRLFSRVLEVSEDAGTATGGSNTTLEDTKKNWQGDMWINATIHVFKGGIEYERLVSANTATVMTFAAFPAGTSVAAGDEWAVRRLVTIADINDRATRLLGVIYGSQTQQLLQRATTYDLLIQLRNGGVEIDPRAIRTITEALARSWTLGAGDIPDLSDRAARLLGVTYGSQGQQLLQRAVTFDLVCQLRSAGVEVDPRAIRALTATDILTVQSLTQWGGTALTGRNISLDLANLNITLSALRDAICDATTPRDLLDIYNQLAATLARNIAQIGGTAQTAADWTPLLQKLDVALSTRATEATLAARLDIALSVLRDFQQNVYSQLIGADETVAQSITLDVSGRTLLDIYTVAAAATTFRLDVSNDNTNWITDYLTWAAVTSVKETHTNAFRYLRLKSDAAGVAGNTVTLLMSGGR